jgi:hypothetical protein
MNKTHLFNHEENRCACGETRGNVLMITGSTDATTCERCEATQFYQEVKVEELENIKNEVKQIGVEAMNNVATEKVAETATYKQKVEIEIEVPVGMEVDKTTFGIQN